MIYFKTTVHAALNETRSGRNGALVLVVDDEIIVADTLSTILERAGYVVLTAYDGQSALMMALQTQPDLVITDVSMPRMNGVELAISLGKSLPRCRILLFSGNATSRDMMGLYGGREQFTLLSKPMHPTRVLEHIRVALESDEFSAKQPGSRSRRAAGPSDLRETA